MSSSLKLSKLKKKKKKILILLDLFLPKTEAQSKWHANQLGRIWYQESHVLVQGQIWEF